ncbi:hypothetical protein GY45DRAFT_1219667, partial [Cubamyces sp. BRFM 1775]
LHSGETCHQLGKIPLVLRMPVMVTQNFNVNSGIVNGSIGRLKSIRYTMHANTQHRYLISCTIYFPDLNGEAMQGLQIGEYPILEDTV